MLIDWFTVGAQALNFAILVWLLKRYLYKPILAAVDARERRIAAELANAAQKTAEAQKERDEYQHKNEEFDQQRAVLFKRAADEANAERGRLLDEARKAADAFCASRREALRSEAVNLNRTVRRRTEQEVFAIARRALTDLAGANLEERMSDVFNDHLRMMEGEAKAELGGALRAASAPALVRSTFDLPAAQRAAIQKVLNETFSADVTVRFETSPDLISGIELSTDGHEVAWSIADYLVSLEASIVELTETAASSPQVPASAAGQP